MSPTLTCLAMALVGVDLGYQPYSTDGEEFIIQINLPTLQALRPGGPPIEIDVPREARQVRPRHFRIVLGDESLPKLLPPAVPPPAVSPPTGAPVVVPPPAGLPGMPSGGNSLGMTSSSAYGPPQSSGARDNPRLGSAAPAPTSGTSAATDAGNEGLQPVNTNGGNSVPSDHPWLAMCLSVIALVASNVYVGWLFWDARQRYRALAARTFAAAQQGSGA